MKEKKLKVHRNDFIERLSAFGNWNIYKNHIDFFERKIDDEIKNMKKSQFPIFSSCPNFGVWIRLNSEYMTNKMFYEYSRFKGENLGDLINERVSFKTIKNSILNLIDLNPQFLEKSSYDFKEILESINLVIQLRHSIQHGGIPNILREIKTDYIEKLYMMVDPRNYQETKQIFLKAEMFSDLLPKKTIRFQKI